MCLVMTTTALRCPSCRKPVAPRGANPTFPFCSPRCRMIDLGKWLGEVYRVPTHSADEQEDEVPLHPSEPEEPA